VSDRRQDVSTAAHPPVVGTLVYILFGLIVWSAQFAAIYMAHTIVCTVGASVTIAPTAVVVASIVAVVAIVLAMANRIRFAAALGLPADAAGRVSYDSMFRLIALISIVAICWSAASAFIVSACA
jgi:hypothetical protein